MKIRAAQSSEAGTLSRIAMRSKAYWGYSEDFMAACVDELSVSAADIARDDFHCSVAADGDVVLGFYVLEKQLKDQIELGALFVAPEHIGAGVGKALIDSAKQHAVDLGSVILAIQGDPNAEKFYLAAGAVLTGRKASESIAGRFLPTFEITLIPERSR